MYKYVPNNKYICKNRDKQCPGSSSLSGRRSCVALVSKPKDYDKKLFPYFREILYRLRS